MRTHLDDIDFRRADELERKFRHDVMAHVHAFGEVAPAARDIIHLGATSCYVTDNTDLILMKESLRDLCGKLASAIDALCRRSQRPGERNRRSALRTSSRPSSRPSASGPACGATT